MKGAVCGYSQSALFHRYGGTMGLDIKKMIVDNFLELCERKDLSKITVKDIQEKTGLSRQTFYNHFKDKDDLIQYSYDTVIMPQWEGDSKRMRAEAAAADIQLDVYIWGKWIYQWLLAIRKHRRFMKAACSLVGPNSLWIHMVEEMRREELEWHRRVCKKPLTREMEEASNYHTAAEVYTVLEWVLNDMSISIEAVADKVIRNRVLSIDEVLKWDGEEGPYAKIRKVIETRGLDLFDQICR